jgi:replication-associated recombination protein RarA
MSFTLTSGEDPQRSLALGNPPKPAQQLPEKYRPAALADVVGQGEIVFALEAFLEAPHSCAFIFSGPTGVGKTTLARILGSELGAVPYGGLEEIASGMNDAESVEQLMRDWRFVPGFGGSGWRVVIVDEADLMSPKANQLWLSALENLPDRCVIVFTTNRLDKFAQRFLDRCRQFTFAADGNVHAGDAQALINRVWFGETGETEAFPDVATMRGLIDSDGSLSYRRVVRALEPLLASHRSGQPLPLAPVAPMVRTVSMIQAAALPLAPERTPRVRKAKAREPLDAPVVTQPANPVMQPEVMKHGDDVAAQRAAEKARRQAQWITRENRLAGRNVFNGAQPRLF